MPTKRRHQRCMQGALVLAVIGLLPAPACRRAPAAQSRPIAEDQHSQPLAAAMEHDAAPTPFQVPVDGSRFAVQVAAFDDRPNAEALASRLSEQFGLQVLVAPVESNGATLYRVRLLVGNKDEADKLAETFLRTENLRVWIVPL